MNIVFRIRPPVICLLAGVFALFACSRSDAAIAVKNYYRLGENDPGAVSGGIVTNTTQEIAGNIDAIHHGNPRYTNDVSTDAAMRADSSLSVVFNGSSQWFGNAVLIPTPNNFGIEAWVKPATASGLHVIADDGNGVTAGWALRQNGNVYQPNLPA